MMVNDSPELNGSIVMHFSHSVYFNFVGAASLLIGATDIWHLSTNALPVKNTLEIGKLLLTEFMLPFEVISVLLVAALMGAIVLARGERA